MCRIRDVYPESRTLFFPSRILSPGLTRSRIRDGKNLFRDSGSWIRIRNTDTNYSQSKKLILGSQKKDPGCSSTTLNDFLLCQAVQYTFPPPKSFRYNWKLLKGVWHEIFSVWFFSQIIFPHGPEYPTGGISNFYENSRIYWNVNRTPANTWESFCGRKSFYIFCLKAIGFQYTLMECILPKRSICTQTDINSPNSFIAGLVDTGDKLIASVVATGDLDKKGLSFRSFYSFRFRRLSQNNNFLCTLHLYGIMQLSLLLIYIFCVL